jgi:hypothetical protein
VVETGAAQFGENDQYGVITTQDLLRLVLWATGLVPKEPTALRRLIRQLKPLFKAHDAVTLAEVVAASGDREWLLLAEELKAWANRPLFKQD